MTQIKVGDKVRVVRSSDSIDRTGGAVEEDTLESYSLVGEIVTVEEIILPSEQPYAVINDKIRELVGYEWWVEEVEPIKSDNLISKQDLYERLKLAERGGETKANLIKNLMARYGLKPKSRFVDISFRVEVQSDEDEEDLRRELEKTESTWRGMPVTRMLAVDVK